MNSNRNKMIGTRKGDQIFLRSPRNLRYRPCTLVFRSRSRLLSRQGMNDAWSPTDSRKMRAQRLGISTTRHRMTDSISELGMYQVRGCIFKLLGSCRAVSEVRITSSINVWGIPGPKGSVSELCNFLKKVQGAQITASCDR